MNEVTLTIPDLTHLTLAQVIGGALFLAALDTVSTVLLAIANRNFSSQYVTDFLTSHVLKIVAPIALLATAGHGLPAFGVPEVPEAFAASVAALSAYGVKTIGSLYSSWQDKGAVPYVTISATAETTDVP